MPNEVVRKETEIQKLSYDELMARNVAASRKAAELYNNKINGQNYPNYRFGPTENSMLGSSIPNPFPQRSMDNHIQESTRIRASTSPLACEVRLCRVARV